MTTLASAKIAHAKITKANGYKVLKIVFPKMGLCFSSQNIENQNLTHIVTQFIKKNFAAEL